MAKFQANPVIVDALKIIKCDRSPLNKGAYVLTLENGELFSATPDMTSRMEPVPGDYVVVQSDGYVYLNPKAVFERKYSVVKESFSGQRICPHCGGLHYGQRFDDCSFLKVLNDPSSTPEMKENAQGILDANHQ